MSAMLLAMAAASDCSDGNCAAELDQESAALLQHAGAKATKAHSQVNATEKDGDRTLGETCGNCASTSYYNGDCASYLVCTPPAVMVPGACSTCQYSGRALGAQCGQNADGYDYGTCAFGLTCWKPSTAPPGAYTRCVAVCDEDFTKPGEGTCTYGSCTCRAPTPCRGWAGECSVYCSNPDGSCYW